MGITNIEPYVGPRPFQRIDEAFFFGREKEASELLSLIIANPVLLIYARSGAGKTSLINARLMPMLEREGLSVLPIARVQGRIPREVNLNQTPGANIYVFNTLASWAKQEDDLQSLVNMTLADFLVKEKAADGGQKAEARVIMFDQFEELFTFYPDRWTDRLEFFQQVSDLLEGRPLLLRPGDLRDPAGLIEDFVSNQNERSVYLWKILSPEVQELIRKRNGSAGHLSIIKPLVDDLNRIIQGASLYAGSAFSGVQLRSETRQMLEKQLTNREIPVLNRLLLEDAYPQMIRRRVEGDPRLRVVFSMREDYIAELDPYASVLPNKLRARYRLEPLRQRAALSAVKGPLEKTDLHFAPRVAEQLVENLLKIQIKTVGGVEEVPGEFVEPVQLQVVCQSLWDNVRTTGESQITEQHLREYGDVSKALRAFYEKTIQKVVGLKGVKEWALRRWFEETLITPAWTRGMVFRGEATTGGLGNEVVDELESQHIIRAELRASERWYELSHDRFIQPIKESNNEWRLARSGAVSKRNELEAKAANWDRGRYGDDTLLDESAATEAQRWLESPEAAEVGYSNDLYAFVQSSVAKAERDRERAAFLRDNAQAQAIAEKERQRAEAEMQRREEQERRAESERLRAEEQQHLFETERKRVEEKAQLNARLRRLIAGLAVMFLLSLGTTAYALVQRYQANAERDRANQQTKLAKENEAKATAAQQASEEQRVKAESSAKEAEYQKRVAEENSDIAKKETKRANEQAAEARRQEQAANAAKEDSERQKRIVIKQNASLASIGEKLREALALAKINLERAVEQTKIADEQRLKAEGAAEIAREARVEAETAEAAAEKAKAVAEENLRKYTEIKTVEGIKDDALALERKGDLKGAINTYQRALAMYQQSNDKSGQIDTLKEIGRLQDYSRDYTDSIKSYEKALALLEAGDSKGRSEILTEIGFRYFNVGSYSTAFEYFQNALALSASVQDLHGKYEALFGIANVKIAQGDDSEAKDFLDDALKLAQATGDQYGIASINMLYGEIKYRKGHYKDAGDYYLNALNIYGVIKSNSGLVYALRSLIDAYSHIKGKQAEVDKYTRMLNSLQNQQSR